jgi:putative hydroxymethylpyrimidine transport system substrate-binding protein
LPSGRITQRDVGFDLVPAMLGKRVDATLGGFWNYEGIQLRQRGKHPAIVPVDKAGVPVYDELVIVARRDTLRKKGAIVRRFVQALGRGYADVRADPAAGVDSLISQVPDLAKSRTLEEASVRATLPSFFPTKTSRPFGFQDRAQWKAYGTWMFKHGLLKAEPHADFALTNEFLAGQGA